MTNQLADYAMLASLTVSRWQATRTDKKISQEIAVKHDVKASRAGHYRKYAIDVEAKSFKAVASAAGELRQQHYFYTLPWGQDGARILTAANFEKYSKEMRTLREKFEAAVKVFESEYPVLKSAARVELNGMYDESDYPRDIAAKFGVSLSIMPIPDAEDFRTKLPESAVKEIRASIREELAKTTETAMRDPYERIHNHITRMVDALSDPKAIFRDTLVTGLAELCAVLPGLNLTQDAKLDELRRKCEGMIAGIDAQDLRDVPKTRRAVAQKAREIQDAMAGFMGAAA